MRCEFGLLLAMVMVLSAVARGDDLRVMSFNVRVGSAADDPSDNWSIWNQTTS